MSTEKPEQPDANAERPSANPVELKESELDQAQGGLAIKLSSTELKIASSTQLGSTALLSDVMIKLSN